MGALALPLMIGAGAGLGGAAALGAFRKSKAVEAPVVRKEPEAMPDVGPEVGDIARRKRPRGRMETFLTGDLEPMYLGKKRLLG